MGLFGLKTGIDFANFGLESEMFSTDQCMNVFIVSIPKNKNEIEICEFENHLKKFFVCALI